jgi:hypothetical protein
MKHQNSIRFPVAVAATYSLSLLILCVAVQGVGHAKSQPVHEIALRDDAGAAAAFEVIVPVLRHPRCMNCHSSGDFPRQGDDSHRHTMQIRRGDGQGINAVSCSTCHQDHNLAGLHMPPGAPGWHLPSPAMPMIWEGLTDPQLCELLKDPQQNGHRTPEQIVEHMHTPLVLWGWAPGDGRTPVPMSQHEFFAKVQEWAAKGAACPVGARVGMAPGHPVVRSSTSIFELLAFRRHNPRAA